MLAALAAVALGRAIFTVPPTDLYTPWITPKIFVVFTVAGLGACLLLYLCILARLALSAVSGDRPFSRRLFLAAGAFALLPPFAFYAIQMFSTRHWTLVVLACLLFAASHRGAALLPTALGRPVWATVAAGLAFLPIFVGLALPQISRPSLTLTSPVRFPSADGMVPLGAFWSVNRGSTDRCPGVRDHNQAAWLAARETDFRPADTGYVQLLQENTLATILELAAALQGLSARILPADQIDFKQPAYTELRQILREVPDWASSAVLKTPQFLDNYAIRSASPQICRSEVVIVEASSSREDRQPVLADFADTFSGNEFYPPDIHEAEAAMERLQSALAEGRVAAILSDEPFRIDGGLSIESQQTQRGHWIILLESTPLEATGNWRVHGGGDRFWIAESALPRYMSTDAYRNAARIGSGSEP